MNPKILLLVTLLTSLFLAACNGSPAEVTAPVVSPSDNGVGETTVKPAATVFETLVDEQGQVSVAVTPLNLSAATTTLDFEVAMDTHSMDLGMDLAALATLTAGDGRQVAARLWDAPQGGHHVAGILSFPAMVDGLSLLDGVSRLTITIRDVDAPERTFTWNLSS